MFRAHLLATSRVQRTEMMKTAYNVPIGAARGWLGLPHVTKDAEARRFSQESGCNARGGPAWTPEVPGFG
jgi:hypothetical protein